MSEPTRFEARFEGRIRRFAQSGVQPFDAASVAHTVVAGQGRDRVDRRGFGWLGSRGEHRGWAIVLTLGLLATLAASAIYAGSRFSAPAPLEPKRQLVHLVYGLDGDIFIAEPDGANPVRLADGDPTKACGGFVANRGLVSPDGQHIAYRSTWPDNGSSCVRKVFVSHLATGVATSFPGDGWNIAWDPGSTRLATWVELGATIGVYGVNGDRQALLDGTQICCGDDDPVWSPDGAEALIVKRDLTAIELPLDGEPARPLPAADPRASYGVGMNPVAYAPGRTRVAYAAPGNHIVVEGADGSDRRLFDAAVRGNEVPDDVLWLPNGKQIVYVADRVFATDGYSYATAAESSLRLMNPTTGATSTLITVAGPLSLRGVSPGSDRLLVGQTDAQGNNGSLWTVNTDGSGSTLLVNGTAEGEWMTAPAVPTAH
jgi:hypothetical protein